MALDYNQVTAITHKYIVPRVADNIFDSNPLMKRAQSRFYERVDGGTSILQPLGYAAVSASGWYDGYDTMSTTDNDVITGAVYQWKQIYGNITISGKEEKQNTGRAAVVKLLKQKSMIAEKTVRDSMGTGLYNAGTTTNAIVGLQAIVNTTSTVGGISQSSYSWWQAGSVDSTTTTLTLYAMQTVDNACSIDADTPSVVMTTRTGYNLYYALLQPQQRFMDTETAKAGFTSLMFNGKPVIPDSHCPSLNFIFLNEKYIHLYYHPERNFSLEPFQKPVNQDAMTAKILWMGSFGSSNNRLHGRLSAIAA